MATRTAYAGTVLVGDIHTAANHKRMPGGWIANLIDTTDRTTSAGTLLTIHTVSTPVGALRKIKVSWHAGRVVGTVAGDVFDLIIAAAGTTIAFWRIDIRTTSSNQVLDFFGFVDTVGAGNVVYSASIQRNSGTGTATVTQSAASPGLFLVEDIGPSA